MTPSTPTKLLLSVDPISNVIKQHGSLLMALKKKSAALAMSNARSDRLAQKLSEVEQERDWLAVSELRCPR